MWVAPCLWACSPWRGLRCGVGICVSGASCLCRRVEGQGLVAVLARVAAGLHGREGLSSTDAARERDPERRYSPPLCLACGAVRSFSSVQGSLPQRSFQFMSRTAWSTSPTFPLMTPSWSTLLACKLSHFQLRFGALTLLLLFFFVFDISVDGFRGRYIWPQRVGTACWRRRPPRGPAGLRRPGSLWWLSPCGVGRSGDSPR